jgi:catechol 2,3-dioxygenase
MADGILPRRRAGVLGVHSLDRFGMAVPDLATAARFYDAFGLEPRPAAGGLRLHTFGSSHPWAELSEAPRKALRYLSFGAFAEDMDGLRERTSRLGIERIDPPAGVESNGLWIADPDGLPVEIKVAEKTSPDAPSGFELAPSAGSSHRASPFRRTVARARPRRLAHVLIFARDVARSSAFYRQALGLRTSDEAAGLAAFLHAPHGSDHHVLALVKSDAPGLHHCSWQMGSLQDIGQGAFHMAERGFSAGWGIGRHVLGSNFFHYVRDPWGSFAEYSGGSDFIAADQDWPVEPQAEEDAFYLWGPSPPEDFAFNYEAHPEALRI